MHSDVNSKAQREDGNQYDPLKLSAGIKALYEKAVSFRECLATAASQEMKHMNRLYTVNRYQESSTYEQKLLRESITQS